MKIQNALHSSNYVNLCYMTLLQSSLPLSAQGSSSKQQDCFPLLQGCNMRLFQPLAVHTFIVDLSPAPSNKSLASTVCTHAELISCFYTLFWCVKRCVLKCHDVHCTH